MADSDRLARIAQLAREAEAGWGVAYGRFAAVVSELGLKRGAEIGVAFGGHAESLLSDTDTELLCGVDPYEHQEGYDDPMNLPQEEFDALHDFTLRRLAPFGDRFRLVRMTSRDAADVVDRPLDYVYIDAIHTCDGVWADLRAWTPRIRAGGLVGGHDYGHPDFPGVRRAVDEFCRRISSEPREEGEGVWWAHIHERVEESSLDDFDCGGRSWGSRILQNLRG